MRTDSLGKSDIKSDTPQCEVLAPWGPDLFRVVPGSIERPTAIIRQHERLAEAIDPVLTPELGCGLHDVGEVILRRLQEVAIQLAPHWPDGLAAAVGDIPLVSSAEVDAAGAFPSLSNVVEACNDLARAREAAARFVVPADDLQFAPLHPVATFGSAIGVRCGVGAVWLPSGMLLEALPAIGATLSAHAASTSGAASDAFAGLVGKQVGQLLQGSGHDIAGPIRVGSGLPIHSLVTFNDRQVVALDIAAGLTPAAIQSRLDEGAQALAEIQPGVEVRNRVRSWRLPADAHVVRLQVVSGPTHASPLEGSGAMMTVEDLEWILYSSQRTPEDLWYFVRDLDNPPGVESLFAWDLIDRWEVWKPRKNFYRGGASITSMMFSPHASKAEWGEAEAAAPVERALHGLGLPALGRWPIVDLDYRSGTAVCDLLTDRAYQVMSWPVPVAVATVDGSAPGTHFEMLSSLAIGIAWKLKHCTEAFLAASTESGLTSLRIEFEYQTRATGAPVTTESVGDDILTLGSDERLEDALLKSSFAVETLCGQLVAQAFVEGAREGFIAAWEAAPAGVRIDDYWLPQRAQQLPRPLEGHEAIRSDALRELGEYLLAAGVAPALLESDDAKKFESQTVFPWLIEKFHQAVASLRPDDLLEFALCQLESANHQRTMFDKRLGWERGFHVQDEGSGEEQRSQIAGAARIISFVVEEVLAHPPAGDGKVDDLAWIGVFSIAELCIESCFRSDAIHFQLTRTTVRVSDLHEIEVLGSDEPTDVDIAAYQEIRSMQMLPIAIPIATDQHLADDDPGFQDPQLVLDLMPRLRGIDEAMKACLGFGIDALTGVLSVATQYDATHFAPATVTRPQAFVDVCLDLAVGATPEEYRTVLDWLTLRGTDLAADVIPHWETERRAKRIATSPFVETDAGLWVLPWTAGSTLTIIANYLEDGRLPWPDTTLPQKVKTALGRYRQRRNRAVEKDCVDKLLDRDFLVRGNVKPEKTHLHGISSLTGEIDALCIDPDRSRIWVIEAKDPYTPYSPRQTRRLVDDFVSPEKYVDRLLCKVADVQASAASVAAAFSAPEPDRPWMVQGLMVTRHLAPAAFAVEPKVAFCVVDDIAIVLDQDTTIDPGVHIP